MPALPIAPMLAKTYASAPSCHYTVGSIVQPKLNGLRCLSLNGELLSRGIVRWHPSVLHHIREVLAQFPDTIFDGELYIHGEPLQTINRFASINRQNPHEKEHLVEFHVFDFINRQPQLQRNLGLRSLHRQLPIKSKVKVVSSFATQTSTQADTFFARFLKQGYEGIMYRRPFDCYPIPGECKRKDLRVASLLKRKTWLDCEPEIIGLSPGKGKYTGSLGAFVCKWNNKVFEISSGISDIERGEYFAMGDLLLGQRLRIEYRELTPDGIPFHGRIASVELPPNFEHFTHD